MLSGSHPHIRSNATTSECSEVHEISKEQEQLDDIGLTVLGYDRNFIREHFDHIIEFAELKDFVDVPLKNYSSGMVARLAFSIATQIKADILVVDEILAVGDFMFQQKCYQRMEEMLSGGTTLLFVSHDAEQVCKLCKRAIWLDHGRLMVDGPSQEVCEQYMAAVAGQA